MSESISPPGDLANADAATPKSAAGQQWAVISDAYRTAILVGPISRTTTSRIYHPDKWAQGRVAFTSALDVQLVASEAQCLRVVEQLVSSAALRDQERGASQARHLDRTKRILEAARDGAGNCTASTTDASQIPGMTPNQDPQ